MRTFDIDIMDLYLPGGEQGTPKKNKPYSSVVQFDQFPGASWAGFWAPKALPGGEQGTPRKTNPTVQLFNLISFMEAPGLDSGLLQLPGGSWAGF